MSVAVAPDLDRLQRLYDRYKSLVRAVSAALLLERAVDDLVPEVDLLLAECAEASMGECGDAAQALSELVQRAVSGRPTTAQLEHVRASHSRLRRAVWDVLPCEYVPCCASDPHHHG
jgi:hypothetical protein